MSIYQDINLSYEELREMFEPFGWAEFEHHFQWRNDCYTIPYTIQIRVILDPSKLDGADLSTDSGVRRAIYEQAERAIAKANEEFFLTSAPELNLSGDIRWVDWPWEYRVVVSNFLEMEVTGKLLLSKDEYMLLALSTSE